MNENPKVTIAFMNIFHLSFEDGKLKMGFFPEK